MEDDRARVDAFVARHFSFRGTLRLHAHAIGWDILRAPANVILAPVFLISRLLAIALSALRLRRPARWLAARRILLPMSTGRALAIALTEEVVRPSGRDPEQAAGRIQDYLSVRSAVSEMCTTLAVFALGFAVFRTATPGIISLAPLVTDRAATLRAVETFPLGSFLGGAWYGVFPPSLSFGWVIGIVVGLLVVAALVSTFAGLIADPVQAALGIHRRRLMRLLRALDRDEAAAPRL
ncbi:MAG: DUF6635 family protein, partial [Pseudomonadota bacterium]